MNRLPLLSLMLGICLSMHAKDHLKIENSVTQIDSIVNLSISQKEVLLNARITLESTLERIKKDTVSLKAPHIKSAFMSYDKVLKNTLNKKQQQKFDKFLKKEKEKADNRFNKKGK